MDALAVHGLFCVRKDIMCFFLLSFSDMFSSRHFPPVPTLALRLLPVPCQAARRQRVLFNSRMEFNLEGCFSAGFFDQGWCN